MGPFTTGKKGEFVIDYDDEAVRCASALVILGAFLRLFFFSSSCRWRWRGRDRERERGANHDTDSNTRHTTPTPSTTTQRRARPRPGRAPLARAAAQVARERRRRRCSRLGQEEGRQGRQGGRPQGPVPADAVQRAHDDGRGGGDARDRRGVAGVGVLLDADQVWPRVDLRLPGVKRAGLGVLLSVCVGL